MAGVIGKILSFEKADDGIILINVEYEMPDGTKIINPYYAQYSNFEGKNAKGIMDFIKAQIDYQCERYLEEIVNNISIEDVFEKVLEVAIPYKDDFKIMLPTLTQATIDTSLTKLANTLFTKDKIIYNISDKGEILTEQLSPELASKYTIVKTVSISQDGTTTVI